MATIGYATLQIIPSLDGVSDSVDKQLGGKFSVIGKRAGKDLSRGVGDGLKDAQKDLDKFGDTAKKAFDKAADAAGKLRTAETQLKQIRDSGNEARIVAAEEKVAKARRDSERAARDSTKAQKDHQDALSSLKPDVAASGLSRLADGFKGAAAGAATFVAAGAVVALGAIAATAIDVTQELYKLGAEFDDMSDNIAFKTGSTGSALDVLKNNVTDIAKDTPASIGTIGEVVAEVTRSLHLTGPALEGVSQSIVNLNRRVGESLDIRNLGKAFRGFGVDAKDQQRSLDQLYTASTNTGLSINTLIESVVQGGAPLRELGLNFGQSAGLIAAFEDAGLPADKMITGMRKSLTEFAKDGKAAPDALRETITQIQKFIAAGDNAGAQNLANKLFGAKTGINFFDAIKSGALDLEALNGAVDDSVVSINDMATATDDGAEQWQKFKNKIEIALQPIATKIFDLANSGLTELADWVDSHQTGITEFFIRVGDVALALGNEIVSMVGVSARGLALLVNAFGDTYGAILRTNAAFKRYVLQDSSAADELDGMADKAFGMGDSLYHIADQADAAQKGLTNTRQSMRDMIANLETARPLTDGFRDSLKSLATTGENVTIDIKENTPEVIAALDKLHIHTEAIANDPTHMRLVADTAEAQRILDAFFTNENNRPPVQGRVTFDPVQVSNAYKAAIAGLPAGTPGADPLPGKAPVAGPPALQLDPKTGKFVPSRAAGGALYAPGPKGKDSALFWGAAGEWVSSAPVVDAMGGFTGMAAFEKTILHRATGGGLGGGSGNGITSQEQQTMWDALRAAFPDAVLTSATRTNQTEGHPDFHNAGRAIDISGPSMDRIAAWIAQNYPDSLELIHAPFGHNIKNGKDVGDGLGLYGAGTMSGHHDHVHWALGHLARINAAATAATGDNDAASPSFDYAPRNASPGPGVAASVSGGGNSVPSSFSELSGFGLDNLGAGIGKTSSGSDLSLFGKAAGAAVSGQVSSALGVFGAGDSPGWLKGLSTLVGGIKVSGGDGSALSPLSVGQGSTSSAAPIAATSRHHGVPAPDDAEGRNDIRKGATPGTVYNIRTATVEDAFLHAQRRERERAAAKLDRF